MQPKRITPILNVSNIQDSFAWFEKLGWEKSWAWGDPPDFGGICAGSCEIFLCENVVGIQLSGNAKFVDGSVPLSVQRIGMPQVVVRPRLVGRFFHRVGPERELISIEGVPLDGHQAESNHQNACHACPDRSDQETMLRYFVDPGKRGSECNKRQQQPDRRQVEVAFA